MADAATARRLSEKTLRKVFDGLDTDGDGRLTKEDLQKVWPEGSGRLSELFDRLDLDRTGTLSFKEFLIAYEGMHEQAEESDEEENPVDRQLQQVFDFVDVDGDGMITVTELAMAANQVIGRPLTEIELQPLTTMFGGSGGLTFRRFKSFLVGWARGNQGDDQAEDTEEDEPEAEVAPYNPDSIGIEPRQRQLLARPSFVRDNSNTIISSEDGDPELLMARRELRTMNILLNEVQEERLALQAECDELRFDHDQLAMLTTTLRTRVVSLEATVQHLKDELQTRQLNLEIAHQEAASERLEKARLQKEMRALQTECAELRARLTIQEVQASEAEARTQAADEREEELIASARVSAANIAELDDTREELAILKLECRQLTAQNAELKLRLEQASMVTEKLKQEKEDLRRNLQFLNDVVNQQALSTAPASEASNRDSEDTHSHSARSSRRHSLADELYAEMLEQPTPKHQYGPNTAAAFLFVPEKLPQNNATTAAANAISDLESEDSDFAERQTEVKTTRLSPQHSQDGLAAESPASQQPPAATGSAHSPPAPKRVEDDEVLRALLGKRPTPLDKLTEGRPSSGSEPLTPSEEVAESRPMSKKSALFAKNTGGSGSPVVLMPTPEAPRHQPQKSTGENALQKLLKDDMAKDGPPADINVAFRGDYLGVANDSALKAAILQHGGSGDERVLFADSVRLVREKILSFGGVRSTNEKRRVLILTSHAVYNVRPHGWRISRRIPLENLVSIRLNSKGAGLFVMQVAEGGDCIFRSARWIELVSAVRRAAYQKRKINLDADYKDNVHIRMDDGTTVILEVDVATQMVSLRRLQPVSSATS